MIVVGRPAQKGGFSRVVSFGHTPSGTTGVFFCFVNLSMQAINNYAGDAFSKVGGWFLGPKGLRVPCLGGLVHQGDSSEGWPFGAP